MKHLIIPRKLSEETRQKNRDRNKIFYQQNKEYYKQWTRDNVKSKICSVAKHRAKKRSIPFDITPEDIILPTHCPVLGIELKYNQGSGAGGKDNSYSLDRINPALGYVKGNIQVISNKANSMKFTATPEELKLFASWINKTYD